MQFPYFQFPVVGDPLIIELDAVLHVFISHGVAIGMVFMIVLAEYLGYKRKAEAWERLAREAIKPTVIIITGIGAVTGVGIWFITAGLVPPAIGSMLRVFCWPWFIEWNVFFWEVVVILVYYFTWHRWQGARKASHVHLGFGYVALGSLSAFLITGILAFLLTSDGGPHHRSLWPAFFHPSFLSQLCWRLAIAFARGALFLILYIRFFPDGAKAFRQRAVSYYATILILPLIGMVATGWWWLDTLPPGFKAHAKPSILIWVLAENIRWFWVFPIGGGILLGLLILAARIRNVPASRVLIIPSTRVVLFAVAEYERVREFIRGPYLMPGYMYANELMLTEHELFTKGGLLPNAYWFKRMAPTATLEQEGAFLFAQNCGTCHTIGGKNDIRDRFAGRTERGIYVILGRTEQMVPWMPLTVPRPEGSYPDAYVGKYAPWWFTSELKRIEEQFATCPKCSDDSAPDTLGHPMVPCIQAIESALLPDGMRHTTYYSLASVYAGLNMHYPEIVARLQAIDACHPILDPNDIAKAAEHGCRHPCYPPCGSVLRQYCPEGGCELGES